MSKDERAKTARVVLVRHGEGRANVDGVIAGLSSCKGLTALGQRQVEALSTRWSREVSGGCGAPKVPESAGRRRHVSGAHATISDASLELGDAPTLLFATTE